MMWAWRTLKAISRGPCRQSEGSIGPNGVLAVGGPEQPCRPEGRKTAEREVRERESVCCYGVIRESVREC